MDEKFKQFLNYDWVNSQEWRTYYDNLYPVPPGNKILYYKKKFYKLKVDNEFDLTYQPEKPEEDKPFEKIPERAVAKDSRKGLMDQVCACIEGFMIMTFLFAFSLGLSAKHPALVALIVGCLRRVGMIKFNKQYMDVLLHNEEFQSIIYVLILYFYSKLIFVLYLPLVFLLLLNVCEYFKHYLTIMKFLIKYFEKVINHKDYLLGLKAKFEIFMIVFFIVSCFFDFIGNIVTFILYSNYIRTKYHFNMYISTGFGDLNRFLVKFKHSRFCPLILAFLVEKIQTIGCYLVKRD
jgi:hypothetical protein